MTCTIDELWNACKTVLSEEEPRWKVGRVAGPAGATDSEVIVALIKASGWSVGRVTFRYPPIPCAAITAIGFEKEHA